jgi:hypothetical protein
MRVAGDITTLEFQPGIESEFLREERAGVLVNGERFTLAAQAGPRMLAHSVSRSISTPFRRRCRCWWHGVFGAEGVRADAEEHRGNTLAAVLGHGRRGGHASALGKVDRDADEECNPAKTNGRYSSHRDWPVLREYQINKTEKTSRVSLLIFGV